MQAQARGFKPKNLSFKQMIEVDACMRCNECLKFCPVVDIYGNEVGPRGKIHFFRELIKGNDLIARLLGRSSNITEEEVNKYTQNLYICTSCLQCREVCEAGINTVSMWEAMRADVVERGNGPMPAHRAIRERVEKLGNPYNENPEKRLAWIQPGMKIAEKADLLFFVGCTSALRMTMLAQAVTKILNYAKIEFTYLGKAELCCGSPLLRTGQRETAYKVIRRNVELIKQKGVKKVVAACAGCANTSKNDWPKVVGKLPFEVQHISEFFLDLVMEGRLKFNKTLDLKVTYHDPCHIGRHMKLYEEPRKAIESIPGVKIIEMKRNREMAMCCGAGGGFRSAFSNDAIAIASKRVRQAQEETQTNMMVTSCPFCRLNLTDGAKSIGADLKVINIEELYTRALGL
ncbi:MAG: heterodisulfide reductase-related iron-sulfur binding cluster [Halobacteria archaeon]